MSKFSKTIFVTYIISLFIINYISNYVYWGVIILILFLQMSNMILRKWVDNRTKYKDSIIHEDEKLRFFYMYFGFPITVCFPNHFRQIRKDTFFERRVKELEERKKFYTEHGAPITDEIKEELINCNRYLKLRKIKQKQEET